MNIGVYFRSRDQSAGGSHSYITTVVNELTTRKYFSPFNVFLITDSKDSFPSEGVCVKFLLTKVRIPTLKSRVFSYLDRIGFHFDHKYENVPLGRWFLKKNRIDFIWSLEPESGKFHVPYATTIWDLEHRKQPFNLDFEDFSLVGKREFAVNQTLRNANVIFSGSAHGMQEIEKYYPNLKAQIHVLPFPIKQIPYSPKTRKTRVVFYPAQFWSHKNHKLILNSLKETLDAGEEPFEVVFTGADKGYLSQIIDLVSNLNLTPFVTFAGLVSNEKIRDLYLTSSVMVFPSLFGPDNLPPIESLYFRCPTLVADIPGARTVYGDHVGYFDPNSPKDLREVLKRHFENLNLLDPTKDNSLIDFLESRTPSALLQAAERAILREINN